MCFGKWMSLLFCLTIVLCDESIVLNNKNTVILKDVIDEKAISNVIYQLYKKKSGSSPIYLYIHSPGGNVNSGNLLIDFIRVYEKDANLICVTSYAASMAFAILQSCKKRYSSKRGVLMQHQIRVNNIQEIKVNELTTYVEYMNNLNQEFVDFQSIRIGMPKNKFVENTKTDWWITAVQGLKFNIVDKLVNIICDSDYALTNYTESEYHEKYTLIHTYSNCPLITKPIDTKYVFDNK